MQASGIAPEHITISGLCTWENAYLFYSHRRDNGRTGAMAAVMELI
jgi:copper oxidase (laccase) domain-containing protein